jgi:hypothetical protein
MDERRRSSDPRVDKLVKDVESLTEQLHVNTVTTIQVRDILASFAVFGKICKWLTAVIGLGAAIVAFYKGLVGITDITPKP